MCIAILKKEKATIKKSQLEESFNSNPDGSGYLFAKDGRLTIKKGYFKFDDFYNDYKRDMEHYNNPVAIIHFRITTHGLTNETNCHPFMVNDKLGFAHNGMIDIVSDHKKKSDTMMFNREILQQLPNNFIHSDSIIKLIEESIGNSKLIFLNNNGFFRIANENKGHWSKDGQIWYSNHSYCETPTTQWAWGHHYNYYTDYDNLNITRKKKKKKKNNIERVECRTCQANLTTIGERQIGHCQICQDDHMPLTVKRI